MDLLISGLQIYIWFLFHCHLPLCWRSRFFYLQFRLYRGFRFIWNFNGTGLMQSILIIYNRIPFLRSEYLAAAYRKYSSLFQIWEAIIIDHNIMHEFKKCNFIFFINLFNICGLGKEAPVWLIQMHLVRNQINKGLDALTDHDLYSHREVLLKVVISGHELFEVILAWNSWDFPLLIVLINSLVEGSYV